MEQVQRALVVYERRYGGGMQVVQVGDYEKLEEEGDSSGNLIIKIYFEKSTLQGTSHFKVLYTSTTPEEKQMIKQALESNFSYDEGEKKDTVSSKTEKTAMGVAQKIQTILEGSEEYAVDVQPDRFNRAATVKAKRL